MRMFYIGIEILTIDANKTFTLAFEGCDTDQEANTLMRRDYDDLKKAMHDKSNTIELGAFNMIIHVNKIVYVRKIVTSHPVSTVDLKK